MRTYGDVEVAEQFETDGFEYIKMHEYTLIDGEPVNAVGEDGLLYHFLEDEEVDV